VTYPDSDYVAPAQSSVDHETLRTALAAAWTQRSGSAPSDDGVAILLAQAALETARWTRCPNWNFGGIKAEPGDRYTFSPTLEVLPRDVAEHNLAASTPDAPCERAADNGGPLVTVRYLPRSPSCRFASYSDMADGVRGYVGLLARRYGAALDAAHAGDVGGFVQALHARGYFTASAASYQRDIASLVDEYRLPCLSARWEIASAFSRFGIWPGQEFIAVVMRFQREHPPLKVDGAVGPKTRAAIRAALAAIASSDSTA